MPVRAKLPPGTGKRVPLNMRTTRELRGDLEKAAANSGRSLAQEVEHRLERSLQQEADSGSRQLHGLLHLLVGATKIIQERRGKSPFDDWDTWIALRAAWNKLIGEMAPEPPPDIIRHRKNSDELQLKKPVVPEFPPLPDIPNSLLARKLSLEAYEKDRREYQMRLAEYQREFDKIEQERQKLSARITDSANLGRDVATELFPSSLNRE